MGSVAGGAGGRGATFRGGISHGSRSFVTKPPQCRDLTDEECILGRMADRDDALLRVDSTGTVHPVGRVASQMLRARNGEWRIQWSPSDVIFLRADRAGPVLKLAGEVRAPGAVCDTISLIAQSNWHGELVVVDETGMRSLYFDQGNLVGAATTVEAERLGEVLYRFGVVTRTQVEETVASAKATGKRLPVAFVLGFVG